MARLRQQAVASNTARSISAADRSTRVGVGVVEPEDPRDPAIGERLIL